jgi:hypothetical protein
MHINQDLGDQARKTFEESMRQIDGVGAPRVHAGQGYFLLVAFNPAAPSTAALLAKVQSFDYKAKLVGV